MSAPDLRAVALCAADRMPVLPSAFQQTLSLLAKGDDVSVGDLGRVVQQDVVMAGQLVSIANSALYSRASAVFSVRHAIARIGINKTRNALLGLSVSRSFSKVRFPKNWSPERFNAHSLATAILSDLLTEKVQTDNAEWAFLAGLLHDVGLLLIATGLPDRSLAFADVESDYQLAESERELLGFTHFEVGADLLGRWYCPPVVQDASIFCQRNAFEIRSPQSLGMIVKTASLLADANGMSVFGRSHTSTLAPELLDALSIQAPTAFMEEFRLEYSGFNTCVASPVSPVSR